MGILDKKTRILDVVLTNRGRELLSKNQLTFAYYAFSDEGVDYKGALTSSVENSSSVESEIHKSFILDADYRNCTKGTGNREIKLNSYLFTANQEEAATPQFFMEPNLSTVSLERNYTHSSEKTIVEDHRALSALKSAMAIVYSEEEGEISTAIDEDANYLQAVESEIDQLFYDIMIGKSVKGRMFSDNWIFVTDSTLQNIKDPTRRLHIKDLTNVRSVAPISKKTNTFKEDDQIEDRNFQIINSRDEQEFEFYLKTESGKTRGNFMIEFFESGSNGELLEILDATNKDKTEKNISSNKLRKLIEVIVVDKG
jgi:hypothetical protein